MASKLKPLPIGIQSFADLINGGYTYVDKTQLLYELVKNSKGVYFLSRPRRFGKSLLISTLDALFSNHRELFNGLWIDSSDYKWQEYPVIRIDMSNLSKLDANVLNIGLIDLTDKIAQDHGLEGLSGISPGANFRDLITGIYHKYKKQVVVLIDEYDKPILDRIADTEAAKANRDALREFYSILKAQDQYLRFVFLTGVSKFSKVSIFSGLNNLEDLSINSDFASVCGYTQEELSRYFKDYIEANGFQNYPDPESLRNAIRDWYNGYRFSPYNEIKVYNPFSTLLLFKSRTFQNYWFATGTPKFLIDIIEAQKYTNINDLENLLVKNSDIEKFDLDNFHLPSVLYQTGYLTITRTGERESFYLGYPNREVRESLLNEILVAFSKQEPEQATKAIILMDQAILTNDLDKFFELLKSYLAGIPYDIQLPLEKYYQSMIYMICRLISENYSAEVRTSTGRIDMLLETKDHVYIFEFKIDNSAENAMKQIREKKYYEKYLSSNKAIKLIGVSFSTTERNITEWLVADYLKL